MAYCIDKLWYSSSKDCKSKDVNYVYTITEREKQSKINCYYFCSSLKCIL